VWSLIGLAAVIVVTAWTGVYYAAFTLILGAAALVWRFAHRARWKSLAIDATPFVAIAVLALLGALPSILTTRGDPPLGIISERLPYESVVFAGYLAVALLPLPSSSLPGFDFYNRSVNEAIAAAGYIESAAATNYGTWITAGALLVIIGALIARNRYPHKVASDPSRKVTLSFAVYLIIVTTLWFIPWGLNYLFAGTVTAQIRAWNRLTPYLLLFFLLGAAAALHRTRLATKPVFALTASAIVLSLTFVDAVVPFRTAYADNAKKGTDLTKAGRSYADLANASIPENCGVLQLPTMGYPEIGVIGDINDYDHFWPSTTNPGKRWSYGAVKSTDASVWSSQLPDVPNDAQVALLRGAGFCAIHIDRRGWPDSETNLIIDDLTSRFGNPIATEKDGDWVMFDIRSAEAADSQAAEAFLYQPLISADPTTTHPRESELSDSWWWTRAEKSIFTITPIRAQFPVTTVKGDVATPECGPRPVVLTLTANGQTSEQTLIALPDVPTPFELSLPEVTSEPASLTVFAQGPVCESRDLPSTRFAKIGNLITY
jgi:phosphoglycerol transferase